MELGGGSIITSSRKSRTILWPTICLAALLLLAFWAASVLQDSGFLSPIPPASEENPTPVADTPPERMVDLYRAAFTAWAALLLFIPAIFAFFKGGGHEKNLTWKHYWTVSFIAFSVHMYWSMVGFFQGDIAWMTTSTRVSAFWPGIALLIWWGIDVALAWLHPTPAKWIKWQRQVVHVVALIMFVGGSLGTGETLPIRAIGLVALVLGISAMWLGRTSRKA